MGPFYLIIPHLGGSFLRYQNQWNITPFGKWHIGLDVSFKSQCLK
jgi:hypothetical protein